MVLKLQLTAKIHDLPSCFTQWHEGKGTLLQGKVHHLSLHSKQNILQTCSNKYVFIHHKKETCWAKRQHAVCTAELWGFSRTLISLLQSLWSGTTCHCFSFLQIQSGGAHIAFSPKLLTMYIFSVQTWSKCVIKDTLTKLDVFWDVLWIKMLGVRVGKHVVEILLYMKNVILKTAVGIVYLR